jgi:hypothetical protein
MKAVAIKRRQFKVMPPPGFQTMGAVRCDDCGEEFFIWHHQHLASPAVAERQAHWLEKALAYEHERDQKHPDRIELPE